MRVQDAMTGNATYIAPETTLREAAQKMRELDTGFLPIGDKGQDRLLGVVTDRDLTIRALADGLDPETTRVDQVTKEKVLYCFQDDSLDEAGKSMHDQQVYRLIVLDSREKKRLCGVISLGDIIRHREEGVAGEAMKGIAA